MRKPRHICPEDHKRRKLVAALKHCKETYGHCCCGSSCRFLGMAIKMQYVVVSDVIKDVWHIPKAEDEESESGAESNEKINS